MIFIIVFVIGVILGGLVASLVASNKINGVTSGKLIIAESDEPDGQPYIFLELTEPVETVEQKDYVQLKVSHK